MTEREPRPLPGGEICNECGRSVAWGSGDFVNRVIDLNDIETRIEMGKPFPTGDFICAECDYQIRDRSDATPLPERDPKRIPPWAERERGRDLEWIRENWHIFWPASEKGFEESGRGAIVSDTTTLVRHEGGESNPFAYLPAAEIERQQWEDVIRMVKAYDPAWEIVCVLLKSGRESAYRVGVPPQRGKPV